jgi:hypothetical protein
MEYHRASSAIRAPSAPMTDENAPALMAKRAPGAGGGLGGASGGLGARMGQKSFGDVKTPARAALGNITNRGRPEGGGTQMSARKPGLVVRESAPGVSRTPAPSVKKAGAETFLESVKAKMSAEQLAEMRQRAERYTDEADDIEYFAGKTREEQLKDLEAKQRAEVEERVREVLDGGFGKPAYRSPLADDVAIAAGVNHLRLSENRSKNNSNIFDEDDYLGVSEDDMCNFKSPGKESADASMADYFAVPSVDDALDVLGDELEGF